MNPKTPGHQKEKKSPILPTNLGLSLRTPTCVQKCCLLPLEWINSLAENKILESHFLSLADIVGGALLNPNAGCRHEEVRGQPGVPAL